MGMNRLMLGILLILTFVLINVVVAIGQGTETHLPNVVSCEETEQTHEDCESVGKGSFLKTMLKVTVSGIQGMPAAFNAVYVLVGGTLLVAGALLIVAAFVPTLGH